MKDKIQLVARIILGLILLVFGLNVFFQFLPQPEMEMPEAAQKLIEGMMAAQYFMPLIGGVQVVVAVMLLTNRFVALGLLLLAPLSVNIILYHAFLDLKSILPGLIVAGLNLYLMFANKTKYDPVLSAK